MTSTKVEVFNGTADFNNCRANVSWAPNQLESVITFTFTQYLKGEEIKDPAIYAKCSFDMTDLPSDIYIDCRAARHGIEQKLRDSLAMTKDDKATATVQFAVTILEALWLQLTGQEAQEEYTDEEGEIHPAVEAVPASWNKLTKERKSGVKDLTDKLDSIWTLATDEMKQILVKSGMYTAEGKVVKK